MSPKSTSSASASPSAPLIFLRINENEINIQHPTSNIQRGSKSQAPKRAATGALGIWILDLPWSLDLGSWMFHPHLTEHGTRSTHLPLLRHRLGDHPYPPRHHHLPGHHVAGRH